MCECERASESSLGMNAKYIFINPTLEGTQRTFWAVVPALRSHVSFTVQYFNGHKIWCYSHRHVLLLVGLTSNHVDGVRFSAKYTQSTNCLTMNERAKSQMKRRWSWKIKLYNLFRIHYSLDEFVPCVFVVLPLRRLPPSVELCWTQHTWHHHHHESTTNNLHSNFRCPFPHSYRLTAFLSFANNKQKYSRENGRGKPQPQIHAGHVKTSENITRKLHLQFPVDIFSRRFDWVILVLKIKILSARLT